MFTAKEIAPSKWVVWNTIADKRHSAGSYFHEWQAERAAADCEAAFNAGADHGATIRKIQEMMTTPRCDDHGTMLPCTLEHA